MKLQLPKPCVTALSLAVILSVPTIVHASIITAWDFNSLSGYGPSPYGATTIAPNTTITGLTRGSGVGTGGTAAASAWGGSGFSTTSTSEAQAIAANNFATFAVVADIGYTVSFADIPSYNVRHSATGPSTGIWQYSTDGINFTDIGSAITWGSNTTSTGNTESAITLSGISALQLVPGGTTVTFRVVTWGATNTSGTWYLNDPQKTSANDLVVEGVVAPAPEPASLSLLAIGLVGLITRRKSRCAN